MADPEAFQHYNTLRSAWHEAHQRARGARLICTRAFADCSQGSGTGPSIEQMNEAEHWERQEDALSIELDSWIRQNVGPK